MTVRGGHLAGTRKPHSPAYSVSAAGTSVLLVVAEWDTAGRFVTRYHVVWSGKVAGSVLTTTDCLRWDGPFGSTVIEVDLENFGDWEGRFRAPMERPWMGESSCRMMPLVESDRREFDTVDEEPVV